MKYTYQIIITKNNKQTEYIGSYHTVAKANKVFHNMLKECEKVVFPIRYTNLGKTIHETNIELVIIKRKDAEESKTTLLRNNYGEYVEHETSHDEWIVYDKAPYYIEDTFWVYGFHPLFQRKTIHYIFDEIIKPNASKKSTFLNIMLYKNKLFFETTYNSDLVICKNKSDAIRLYNTIERYCSDNKLKYVMLSGDWNTNNLRSEIIEKIHKLTNWNKLKITRSSTKP